LRPWAIAPRRHVETEPQIKVDPRFHRRPVLGGAPVDRVEIALEEIALSEKALLRLGILRRRDATVELVELALDARAEVELLAPERRDRLRLLPERLVLRLRRALLCVERSLGGRTVR